MEVYMDDMLVKSLKDEEHIENMREFFEVLCKYKMKLNPVKCVFGVHFGKFLGFMVMCKDVQSLIGHIAVLNRFILKATDKCQPFFHALRKGNDFVWTS